MDKTLGIALILSAKNKASVVFDDFVGRASKKMELLKKAAVQMGEGMAEIFAAKKGFDMVKPTLDAYGAVQESQKALHALMLDSSGNVNNGLFNAMTNKARALSEQLGETQEHYLAMEAVLKGNRIAPQTILQIAEPVAQLAKYLRVMPDEAALFASRMVNDMHVAASEIPRTLDIISRGFDATRMGGGQFIMEQTELFATLSASLSTLQIKGIAASSTLLNLGNALTAKGLSGTVVGTALNKVLINSMLPEKMAKVNAIAGMWHKHLTFFDKKGKYMGVDNLVKQIDSLSNLNPQAIATIFSAFGLKGGKTASFLSYLATNGLKDVTEMQRAKDKMAGLQQKVGDIMAGQAQQEARLQQIWRNNLSTFGEAISAPYMKVIGWLQRTAAAMEGLFRERPRLAQVATGIIGIASAGAGLLGVINIVQGTSKVFKLLGLVGPVGGAVKAFEAVKFGAWAFRYSMVTSVIPALSSAMAATWAFTAALLANPITWIAVGVVVAAAAIAAGAVWVYKNWDLCKQKMQAIWERTKEIFHSAVQFIYRKVMPFFMPQILIFQHWDKIGPWLQRMWDNVKGIFMGAVNWIFNLHKLFYNAGANIFKSIWEGMKAMAHKPIEAVMEMTKKIRAYLPFSPAKEGALRDIHRVQLVETIAASIKPDAMVHAWGNAIGALRGAIGNSTPIPIPGAAGSGGGFSGHVNFSVTVNLNGGATQQDANMITAAMREQFKRMYQDFNITHHRVNF